jgi:uncharacterized protein (DUF849 family)
VAELAHRHPLRDAQSIGRDIRQDIRKDIRATPMLRAMLAAVLILAAAAVVAWWAGSEQRALLALPGTTRFRIYKRSFNDMTALCGSLATANSFTARCREKATFLAQFPECESECRILIDPYLPKPTR